MATKRMRRLPDDRMTDDPDEYIDAWKGIADRLEQILDCRVFAFDPSFSIIRDGDYNSTTLPVWIAEKIIDMNQELCDARDELITMLNNGE